MQKIQTEDPYNQKSFTHAEGNCSWGVHPWVGTGESMLAKAYAQVTLQTWNPSVCLMVLLICVSVCRIRTLPLESFLF